MTLQFRRWTLFLGLLGLLCHIPTRLLAQDQELSIANQDSGTYAPVIVRSYNIRKIYSHRLGYRIDIQDYRGKIRTIYAKISWFVQPEQRDPRSDSFELAASMNYKPISSAMPSNYLTLQYEDGELISLIIYVDEPNHSTNSIWYQVDPNTNIDSKFDIKTLVFSPPPQHQQKTQRYLPDSVAPAKENNTEEQ